MVRDQLSIWYQEGAVDDSCSWAGNQSAKQQEAIAVEQTVLLSSIGGCCAANDLND